MDDESVRRRFADATGRERAGDVHGADHGDDRKRRTDGGRRPRDASTRDQDTPRHQAAEDLRLHQHNVVMNRQAVNSTPLERDSDPRAVGDDAAHDAAVEGGYRRRDDPVQRARIAVDQLVTRRREIEQQRAEATRTEQVNGWHHDGRSTSRAARSSLADDWIDGGGVAR
jgi:hypothetical protein